MDFKKALQTFDSNFESILKIMKLRNEPKMIDAVRNLLLVVNLILEYFMNRESDELKIPVVYFPISQKYAQELCEDFVTLKLGLYTNKEWKDHLCRLLSKKDLYVPSSIKTRKQHLALRENHRYENQLSEILSRSRNEFNDYGKILIYSEKLQKEQTSYHEANKYNRKLVNKYWYLRHAINDSNDFLRGDCPLSLLYGDSDLFYEHILENEGKVKIQNIIVFPTKSPDGRYSEFCANSFQKPYIDDFINTDCGLKNVFFFCFSHKPYRLRRLVDFKQRMKERIQIFEDRVYDFISFKYEEALTLTNQNFSEHLVVNIGKDSNDIQDDYETLFDDITNGLDRHVSRRNEMSLCFSDTLSKDCENRIQEETEADENLVAEILRFNSRLWKKDAEVVLQHFVFKSNVFIITGNDINEQLKNSVRVFLQKYYDTQNITFGTFGDLRGYLCSNGEYRNEIKDKKIIIISFRSDYTDSIFHKYPNSFDPYCINGDQQVLEIANYFFLRQYYDWGKYNYAKAIRKILKSEFRDSKMKPILTKYVRPTKRLLEDIREEESDRNNSRTIQKTKVTYSDNHIQEFWRSEWMLYKFGDHLSIAPLSDLVDLYESVTDLFIQPLSFLVRRVKSQFIDNQIDRDNRSERMFKEQPLYGLTQEEIDSDAELWKILLAKRVETMGCQNVYEEVMANFNERYRVSYHSFKRWLEPDYGIPRARKVQKFLVEDYLGIRPPYIKLIRRIKERTKSDTEGITISIRHFLNIALLNDDFNIVYNALSDEIRDLLDINSSEDVEKIVTDVKEIINLEPVKSILQ